jgi:hypothetical protein
MVLLENVEEELPLHDEHREMSLLYIHFLVAPDMASRNPPHEQVSPFKKRYGGTTSGTLSLPVPQEEAKNNPQTYA